ncbi:transmembrane protein 216 [Corythoichthys intestinalis]|uniref:transmembrane protein 216 n=1 Tax=Corythoichthys intestinalis TaxID=161448 RepID=UPI0025A52AC3|nr:transmembrane protein 216 [Corythoichthys intestinalis]XP_061793345.1 transmembrane protein 216-like [Nerophis lumbriciformis]
MAPGKQPILSSVPLQVLLYLNCWYFGAFFLADVLMFVYKGLLLPYPTNNLILDVALLVLFLGLESLRVFYGWKGNLCEHAGTTILSLLLLLPCVTLCVYFLLLQTFVLRLEFLLCSVLLCFYGLQFLLSVLALSSFARSKVF